MSNLEKRIIDGIRYEHDVKARELKNAVNIGDAAYEQQITTLTGIKARVTKQTFYDLNGKTIQDYIPVVVGENAFTEEIMTWLDFQLSPDFESGLIDTGFGSSRLSQVEVALGKVTVPVLTWAKAIDYTIVDVEKAQRAVGNAGWNYIRAKEEARKRNFDLGLQRFAFLGSKTVANATGLLTQSDVTTNTTRVTEPLSGMTAAELTAFIQNFVADYAKNADMTRLPNRMIIPMTDWLGLDRPYSSDYPMISLREYLVKAFKQSTMREDAEILPLAYADALYNKEFINVGSGKQCYALYNYDEESLRMDLPVAYTSTAINTSDGFNWQSVAYAQIAPAKAYRPKEMLYYQY